MSYYSPKIYAFLSVLISIVNAGAFPLFGWVFSKLMFVIMKG